MEPEIIEHVMLKNFGVNSRGRALMLALDEDRSFEFESVDEALYAWLPSEFERLPEGVASIYGIADLRQDDLFMSMDGGFCFGVHPRYIGKTEVSVYDRMSKHMDDRRKGLSATYKERWMLSVPKQYLVIWEIARYPLEKIDEQERDWIAWLKKTREDPAFVGKCVNTAEGGTGGRTGHVYTPEELTANAKKIWESRRRNGTTATWLKGKTQSAEYIAKRIANVDFKANAVKSAETRAARRVEAEAAGLPDPYRGRPSAQKGVPLSELRKTHLSSVVAEAWQDLDEDERERRASQLRGAAADWLDKVRSGEIEDPRLGHTPWNKGGTNPGAGEKAWETRRASGFKSQRELLNGLAEETGLSSAQVSRALKGKCSKVKQSACDQAWAAYDSLDDETKKRIAVVEPEHPYGKHPKRESMKGKRPPKSDEEKAAIAAKQRQVWARMTDEERKAFTDSQTAGRAAARASRMP